LSKRSSRRKRKAKARKVIALTGPVLIRQGKQALEQGNYSKAIDCWEKALMKPNPSSKLTASIAEAYFRRGINDGLGNTEDLKVALKLVPNDRIYRYHLALVYHRENKLKEAEKIYRELLAEMPSFKRAALPLSQLITQKRKSIRKDPVWKLLSIKEQERFVAVSSLKNKRQVHALIYAPDGEADLLWRGLASFHQDKLSVARKSFERVLKAPDSYNRAKEIARYYLGVIHAQTNKPDEALTYWQTAYKNGIDTKHLQHNVGVFFYQQALIEYQAKHYKKALELLDNSLTFRSEDSIQTDLFNQIHWQLGYEATNRNNWSVAMKHWQKILDTGYKDRYIMMNMAITQEKLEDHLQAAEHWREVLRRRPRSANHPDALDDKQVSRLWQHVAENYQKADDVTEAIKTYRNALKWSPDNVDLQINLADLLQTEGRWQAAENELNRILEANPDSVPALTRQAESCESDHRYKKADKEGKQFMWYGNHHEAFKIHLEGAEELHDNARMQTLAGMSAADINDLDTAEEFFSRAFKIDPTNLSNLHIAWWTWLEHNRGNELQILLGYVKAIYPPPPVYFLFDLIKLCHKFKHEDLAEEVLDFIENVYPNNPEALVEIARELYAKQKTEQAKKYLNRVLEQDSTYAKANFILGVIYNANGNKFMARRHWRVAERRARKDKAYDYISEMKTLKDILTHGAPKHPIFGEIFGSLEGVTSMEDMVGRIPPELLKLMLGGIEDGY